MKRSVFILLVISIVIYSGCTKEDPIEINNSKPPVDTTKPYVPTPYQFILPVGWSMPYMPADNPLTVEGVALGRKLFYEPLLSANNQMSCATCHNQAFGFSDNGSRFSEGVDKIKGTRNAMPIFNLAWVDRGPQTLIINGKPIRFFWDGGAADLESQAIDPIMNVIEMHETLPNVIQKLKNTSVYPPLFKKAFGSDTITTKRLMQAIAQFERTIISSGAKIDRYIFNPVTGKIRDTSVFTPEEMRGFNVFNSESKGDCFHCHNVNSPFSTDFQFHHNGHQSSDPGLQRISGNPEDQGKFRTPSLKNLLFTAPYMHDGRFNTLEEVVEFYDNGIKRTFPTDPLLLKHPEGLHLTQQEKSDLVAFLKTMTDSTFLQKAEYGKPQ